MGASMGFGERPDTLNKMTLDFPGPGAHDTVKDATTNHAPKYG